MGSPFAQWCASTSARPNSVYPSTVASDNDKHKAVLLLVILNLGVKPRDTLQSSEIDINLRGLRVRRVGSIWSTSAAYGYGQRLNVERVMGKDKGVVCRYLILLDRWRRRMLCIFMRCCWGCSSCPGIHICGPWAAKATLATLWLTVKSSRSSTNHVVSHSTLPRRRVHSQPMASTEITVQAAQDKIHELANRDADTTESDLRYMAYGARLRTAVRAASRYVAYVRPRRPFIGSFLI